MFHVHGQEESVLSRRQSFPANPIDSMQSQSKAGISFDGHWQADSKVYMEREKKQKKKHKTEGEEREKLEDWHYLILEFTKKL